MKISTKRRLYYTSVIAALVIILACAVIINRTLVNTPEFNIEQISPEAGEPVSAYMAYTEGDGDVVVGIAEKDDETVGAIIDFVRNVPHGQVIEADGTQARVADAWVILYDDHNRISSRLNFYENGNVMWYDGERYESSTETMQQLIEYCDASAADEEEIEEPKEAPAAETAEEKDD